MLAINVYAVNPNDPSPVEGFTSYPEEANLYSRRDELVKQITGDGWKDWSGQRRRDFVERCKRKGWDIRVRLCLID